MSTIELCSTRCARLLFLGSALAQLATGCGEGVTVNSLQRRVDVYENDFLADEQDFAEIADQVPGFAGYYFDSDAKLVIRLTDTSQEAQALSVIGSRPIATTPLGRLAPVEGATPTLEVLPAEYSFKELYAWRNTMRQSVFLIDGVIWLDLDEVRNRVAVGVVDHDVAELVAAQLPELGVPADAFTYELGEYPTPSATINDYNRPVTGALEVGDWGWCTLGFVGRDSVGNNGFFTVSHCSPTMFWPDISTLHQPMPPPNNPIGYETQDPLPWSCGGGVLCRFSDASFYVRARKVYSSFGKIARTLNWYGSKVIDSSNPTFTVIGERSSTVGLPVDKIGASTGWTYGQVVQTCVDVTTWEGGAPYRIICAAGASYLDAQQGDSGSPVFWWSYPTQNVRLVGIQFAIEGTKTYYSTMSGIRLDLGNIDTY